MVGAQVWDGRCRRSLIGIAEALEKHHGCSFSTACGNAGRQAAHRIFAHPTTSVGGLLAGHFQQTAARCREWGELGEPVLAAQDTTELNYSSHPAAEGLGSIGRHTSSRGLVAHSALVMTPAGLPLGLAWASIWARDPATHGKKHHRLQRSTAEKESQKWLDGLAGIEAALPEDRSVIVIADREADFYDYFAAPRRADTQLLVRAHQPRRVNVLAGMGEAGEAGSGEIPLPTALAAAPEAGRLVVHVPRQAGREAREAELAFRWLKVAMLVPRHHRRRSSEPGEPIPVWVFEVREVNPPEGEPPVQWMLITTLPVENVADAERVIRYYARRWGIERLHYTLKSGLRVERLQFDDATSLAHALAVYYVVAWRLLWLTHLARVDPDGPPSGMLNETEREVLEGASGRPIRTRRETVRAIAQLGGFAGNPAAGEPGVKSLWLGLTRLEAMVVGWKLARCPH